MTGSDWSRLEDVFHRAAALPPSARPAFLDRECAGDSELRAQAESLLLHDAPSGAMIQDAIQHEAEVITTADEYLIGRRIGPYRVTGIVGQGGMGTVYRAIRDDDHYRKEVAVKLVRRGCETDEFVRRFRAERQILASLDHPFIARLFDGGATSDGIPYYVMELVDGVPITRYAADRSLSVEPRLRLFQRVCEAVRYAHTNLVIHGDLKPANILVCSDGTPKLLDFGVAKVLGPDQSGTQPAATGTIRLLTPDYASPEQVAGHPLTTATDTYSLGAVLYELLAGNSPHRVSGCSPDEIESTIRTTQPKPPSRTASMSLVPPRRLKGDLDNIVLMALRKEPERRYCSVEQFSEDISRHLEGRPVAARRDSIPYRAGKFLTRNRLPIAAVAAVVIALVIGLVAAALEARRAERRFQQVRKLADAFVFDVHDRIQHLPGATEARKTIVATALEYLENLSHDAAGDTSLILDVAAAYEKIADVQGLLDRSNLGDTQGAVNNYRRAEALLNTVRNQDDWRVRFRQASLHWKLGLVLQVRGVAAGARHSYARAEELIRSLMKERPDDQEPLRLGCSIFGDIATYAVSMRDTERVERATAEQMAIARNLARLDASSRLNRACLTEAQTSLARAYLSDGRIEAAAQADREAVALMEQLLREDPENVSYRRQLMMSYSRLADVLGSRMGENLGDFRRAEQALKSSADVAVWLTRRDSADRSAWFDLAGIKLRSGLLLLRDLHQPARALTLLGEAAEILTDLQKQDPGNAIYPYNLLVVDYGAGEALADLGRTGEAASRLERAAQAAAALSDGYYGAGARAAGTQAALVLAGLKARTHDPGALALADNVAAAISGSARMFAVRWNEASACASLGRVYLLLNRRKPAISWLSRSADIFTAMKTAPAMEPRRNEELHRIRLDLQSASRLPTTSSSSSPRR